MLILGIESATRVASVGVVRAAVAPDEARRSPPGRVADGCTTLGEVSRDTGLAHGAELLALIEEALTRSGVAIDAVRCIAVGIGPGSFTGLRVALATAKGLVLGTDVALVGVSTLEALAATVLPGWSPGGAPPDLAAGSLVASCLDARKGEVYGAVFRVRVPVPEEPSPRLERLSPDAAHRPADFGRALAEHLERQGAAAPPAFLVGDGAERYGDVLVAPLAGRVGALPPATHHPRGAVVARLGAGVFALAGGHDPATLVPLYARASEAEIARRRAAGHPSR